MTVTMSFNPIIAQWGPFQLGWHGVFTTLAVAVAVWLGLRLAERQGIHGESVVTMVTWAVVSGIIGARLFSVADHLEYYSQHPLEIAAVWEGGIAVYGAFIGGLVGGWVYAKRAHLPIWRLLDSAAPAMLVGQAIGRLGCISNGDAWGGPCTSAFCPFCFVYTNANDLLPEQLKGVPTYAYPVYEIVADLALLAILWAARRYIRQPGQVFLAAAVGYGAIRFGLTYFRQETIVLWGLQEAQVIALGTILVAVAFLLGRWALAATPIRPVRSVT